MILVESSGYSTCTGLLWVSRAPVSDFFSFLFFFLVCLCLYVPHRDQISVSDYRVKF